MNDDKAILIEALKPAVAAFKKLQEEKTLLGASPGDDILNPLGDAIDACAAYKAQAGRAIFSANSGYIFQARSMAIDFLYRGMRDIEAAADWLLRTLTTEKADLTMKAAIWGLGVNAEVVLSKDAKIIPFDALPDSPMKERIVSNVRKPWDGSVWGAKNYYDMPMVAYIKTVKDFPYRFEPALDVIQDLEEEARDFWAFLEGAAAGQPLVVGYWYEYEDRDLDLAAYENHVIWTLPEVAPHVKTVTQIDAKTTQDQLVGFLKLPDDHRDVLFRSMKRFALSHCRHQFIDRVLDLALAFEILFHDGGEYAPIGWKVGLRTAQLIGGALNVRQETREKVNQVFKLRNKGTHGSSLKDFTDEQVKKILDDASEIYRVLIKVFMTLGAKPDWKTIELEPIATK